LIFIIKQLFRFCKINQEGIATGAVKKAHSSLENFEIED